MKEESLLGVDQESVFRSLLIKESELLVEEDEESEKTTVGDQLSNFSKLMIKIISTENKIQVCRHYERCAAYVLTELPAVIDLSEIYLIKGLDEVLAITKLIIQTAHDYIIRYSSLTNKILKQIKTSTDIVDSTKLEIENYLQILPIPHINDDDDVSSQEDLILKSQEVFSNPPIKISKTYSDSNWNYSHRKLFISQMKNCEDKTNKTLNHCALLEDAAVSLSGEVKQLIDCISSTELLSDMPITHQSELMESITDGSSLVDQYLDQSDSTKLRCFVDHSKLLELHKRSENAVRQNGLEHSEWTADCNENSLKLDDAISEAKHRLDSLPLQYRTQRRNLEQKLENLITDRTRTVEQALLDSKRFLQSNDKQQQDIKNELASLENTEVAKRNEIKVQISDLSTQRVELIKRNSEESSDRINKYNTMRQQLKSLSDHLTPRCHSLEELHKRCGRASDVSGFLKQIITKVQTAVEGEVADRAARDKKIQTALHKSVVAASEILITLNTRSIFLRECLCRYVSFRVNEMRDTISFFSSTSDPCFVNQFDLMKILFNRLRESNCKSEWLSTTRQRLLQSISPSTNFITRHRIPSVDIKQLSSSLISEWQQENEVSRETTTLTPHPPPETIWVANQIT